jgi:hypothetical protein
MHFSEHQKRSSASREERPLSTSTICISPPARGLVKCEVYLGDALSGGAACEQADEHSEFGVAGNYLLDPHRADP